MNHCGHIRITTSRMCGLKQSSDTNMQKIFQPTQLEQ